MEAAPDPLVEASAAYRRIEAAIRFLADRFPERPSLEQAAASAGLSPHHFQRLFTRWAGISPKRFTGLLTLAEAKGLLAESTSVLDVAYEVGLSGPSRLHDLFVSYEAITPGDYRRMGAGLVLRHGAHPTPFGPAFVLASERGIAGLGFVDDEEDAAAALAEARAAWPLSTIVADADGTRTWIERCFQPHGDQPRVPLLLKGTNFQIQVWQALLRVPPGQLTSYGALARALGRPDGARAVGSAVARNAIAYLVPCHRVIRASGALSGYRWGTPRKAAMLAFEAARAGARVEAQPAG